MHAALLLLQVYCLPDGYEVEDRSLEVIRYVLNPTFKHEEVSCKSLLACGQTGGVLCITPFILVAQVMHCCSVL